MDLQVVADGSANASSGARPMSSQPATATPYRAASERTVSSTRWMGVFSYCRMSVDTCTCPFSSSATPMART